MLSLFQILIYKFSHRFLRQPKVFAATLTPLLICFRATGLLPAAAENRPAWPPWRQPSSPTFQSHQCRPKFRCLSIVSSHMSLYLQGSRAFSRTSITTLGTTTLNIITNCIKQRATFCCYVECRSAQCLGTLNSNLRG